MIKRVAQDKLSNDVILRLMCIHCYGFVGLVVFLPIVLECFVFLTFYIGKYIVLI